MRRYGKPTLAIDQLAITPLDLDAQASLRLG